MVSVLCVDGQVILPTNAMMHSVMAVMNVATLSRTTSTIFLHQEHHATMEDLIWGTITIKPKGTDHTPIMVSDTGDNTADHSPTPIHSTTQVPVLEGTSSALLPATAAAHTTL